MFFVVILQDLTKSNWTRSSRMFPGFLIRRLIPKTHILVKEIPDTSYFIYSVICMVCYIWSKCNFKYTFFWLLLYCSLKQLLKKHLMWHITTYMHFILLKNQLKKVLKTWRCVNTRNFFFLYCILCWYRA